MSLNAMSLSQLGWGPFFQRQLDLEEWETTQPIRVTAVHRGQIVVLGEAGEQSIPIHKPLPIGLEESMPTVGDWLLQQTDSQKLLRILERKSLFRRRAPGKARHEQLIAANVDTLFIVTSCNDDFNPSRIERYLALAEDAEVQPVVVITKIDLTNDPHSYRKKAERLQSGLLVELVNGRDPKSIQPLQDWLGTGQTVALLGSSGTGKSTLINSLAGAELLKTGGIREDDSKGRHTTTHRSLHFLANGGIVVDTPGMRELQLLDTGNGVETVFQEIEEIVQSCRYHDCQHEEEPGCAVRAALESGAIDERRLANYYKLIREQERDAESVADKRRREKGFTKHYKAVLSEVRHRK